MFSVLKTWKVNPCHFSFMNFASISDLSSSSAVNCAGWKPTFSCPTESLFHLISVKECKKLAPDQNQRSIMRRCMVQNSLIVRYRLWLSLLSGCCIEWEGYNSDCRININVNRKQEKYPSLYYYFLFLMEWITYTGWEERWGPFFEKLPPQSFIFQIFNSHVSTVWQQKHIFVHFIVRVIVHINKNTVTRQPFSIKGQYSTNHFTGSGKCFLQVIHLQIVDDCLICTHFWQTPYLKVQNIFNTPITSIDYSKTELEIQNEIKNPQQSISN